MVAVALKKGFTPAPIAKEHSGRQLVRGYTTGTCAQAATKAACLMLNEQRLIKNIEVVVPSGEKLSIDIIDPVIERDFAQCAVIKDAGDDPDITHGIKIYAQARFSDKEGISIKGAEGIGKVTKPGLAMKVGEWAINPIPRKMIALEAAKFFPGKKPGLEITIKAPQGEEIAKKTFNPKLGIIGGISIIGTTGIVEPKSLDAYKASLALELDVLKAEGYKKVAFVLGYVGENFCKAQLKPKEWPVIKIGDHIGFMLEESAKRKIPEVLLIGYIGKLIKVTNRQFNTHYSFGDKRLESLAKYAELSGASKVAIKKILSQKTLEACLPILREAGFDSVFPKIAGDVVKRSEELVKHNLTANCILLSLKGEVLARTDEK